MNILKKYKPVNTNLWIYNKIEDPRRKYHEFAHFLIAPKERKFMKNFGLGPLAEDQEDVPRVVSEVEAFAEEELAATLGIIYEISNGIDPSISMEDHHSCLNSEIVIKKNIAKLNKMGLINDIV